MGSMSVGLALCELSRVWEECSSQRHQVPFANRKKSSAFGRLSPASVLAVRGAQRHSAIPDAALVAADGA